MSEAVVADFVGRFHAPERSGREPERGRIILSQKRLVLVGSGTKTTVPLSAVFDVTVGVVPPELADYFDDTVVVAYSEGNERRTVVVEGGSENVDRFRTVLFKALLQGTRVLVRHPTRVGGRVTDAPARTASLRLEPGRLAFDGLEDPFRVELSSVVHFERDRRTVAGARRPVLLARHTVDGSSVTTAVALSDERRLNVLGRYLRLEYDELLRELEDVSLTEEQVEVLVGVYAGGGVALSELVTDDAATLNVVADSLRENDLVVDGPEGLELTPRGRLVVGRQIEDVNE